jgi:hypothetical protein
MHAQTHTAYAITHLCVREKRAGFVPRREQWKILELSRIKKRFYHSNGLYFAPSLKEERKGTQTHAHTQTHTNNRARAHTHTHAHTYAHTHTYIHKHTNINTHLQREKERKREREREKRK